MMSLIFTSLTLVVSHVLLVVLVFILFGGYALAISYTIINKETENDVYF